MHFSVPFFAALSLLAPVVFAVALPAPALSNDHTIETRGSDEIIYIANCERQNDQGGSYRASYAPWYSRWQNSQNEQPPDANTYEYRDWAKGGSTVTFEGQQPVFKYPGSDTTLYFHIQPNGLNVGFKNFAGYIDRSQNGGSQWTRFNCYRDRDRTLFNHMQLPHNVDGYPYLTCYDTLYYCAPI